MNVDRALRRSIGREALELVAAIQPRVVMAARSGNAVAPTYAGLLRCVEDELLSLDAVGIVIVDGQDEDATYWSAHRDLSLANRRVIEDPWMQPSHVSQLVQMADVVAYAAHQQLTADGRRSRADWYGDTIARLVVHPAAHEGIVRLEQRTPRP